MTKEQFVEWVQTLDPINSKYILAAPHIISEYEDYLRWKNRDASSISALRDMSASEAEEARKLIADDVLEELEKAIRNYGRLYLTPANVKVGDGATINLYSDRHAGTIVKVTKQTVTVRRDKATLVPSFKPEFIPGGFSAYCTNQDEQEWTYEPNENGELVTVHWSSKYNQYGRPGNLTLSKGRHEFYDYNF